MRHPKILDISQTALVVIDLQEAFRSAIPEFPQVVSRAARAVRGFQILNVPVIVTEQYPKGLGRTAEENLLLQVQGMVPEYERAKIIERSRRGKRYKAHNGKISVLGGAPYGYRYVTVSEGNGCARYEIVAEYAQVVQQIFHWVCH